MEIIEYLRIVVLERLASDIGWILVICVLLSIGQMSLNRRVAKLEDQFKKSLEIERIRNLSRTPIYSEKDGIIRR